MSPKTVRIVIALVILLCGLAGGFAIGQRRTLAWSMPMLAAETQFNLAQRVETLAKLRTGDEHGAIAGLEQVLDTATLNLRQGKAWADLDPDVRFTLQLAKAYRERYPPAEPNAALSAWLATIPMPEAQYCSPALRQLLR